MNWPFSICIFAGGFVIGALFDAWLNREKPVAAAPPPQSIEAKTTVEGEINHNHYIIQDENDPAEWWKKMDP